MGHACFLSIPIPWQYFIPPRQYFLPLVLCSFLLSLSLIPCLLSLWGKINLFWTEYWSWDVFSQYWPLQYINKCKHLLRSERGLMESEQMDWMVHRASSIALRCTVRNRPLHFYPPSWMTLNSTLNHCILRVCSDSS